MKCTVYGGGGFIGSAVSERLLAEGHSVCIVEHPRALPYRAFGEHESVVWMRGDMFDASVLEESMEGADALVHLVSTTFPKNSDADPVHDVESNLIGTLRMMEVAVRKGVPKILFISSGGTVYGMPEYLPIDERHPTNPMVAYGATKLAIEKFLLLYAHKHGIKVRILRVANPYGARQRVETAQGAVTAFMHRALFAEPIEIWGDGSVVRDYLHVDDVAEAFLRGLEYEGKDQVFNVGSGTGTSLNELATMVMEATGSSIPVSRKPGRPFDVPVNVLCISKASKQLGWVPKIPLRNGLEKTAVELRRMLGDQQR